MPMSLQQAQKLLQLALHTRKFDHLNVRAHGTYLTVYSREEGEKALRVLLLQLGADCFWLNLAGPKGKIQPTPFVGSVSELFPILTGKLAFSLARWH